MANTYVDYTGDGSETDFNFSFPYINTEHVAVEVNEGPAGGTNRWVRKTLTTDYTVETTPNNFVRFVTAPTNLAKVRVLRDSNATVAIVDFENGSVLTETELDNGYNHNRYLAEEAEEGATGGALTKRDTDHYNADGLKLENLADPDSDDDAVNKGYADTRYVDVAGDTMTGDLNMGSNDIVSTTSVQGLATPSSDNHAANKKYVDDQDALQVTKTGDTMSGALTLPNSDPTDANHATRKSYVDETITTSLATGSPPPGVQLGTAQIEDDAITADKLDNTTVTPGSYTNTDLTVDENGRITAASSGSGGAGTTNLSNTPAASSVDIESSTGTNTTVAGATTSLAGVMTSADKTKLDGIATSANNYTHPNHTGDVTSTGDGATVIANDAVTFAKMQDINTAKVIGRTTAGSGNPEEVSILDEDAMTSNSATALATQQSIKAYVDAQVVSVSKYSTGWQNSIDSVTVADGSTHTITHSLGTDDVTVQVFVATSSAGANSRLIAGGAEIGSSGTVGYNAQIQSLGTNSFELQLGSGGYVELSTSGTMSSVSFASKYIKVVVIG